MNTDRCVLLVTLMLTFFLGSVFPSFGQTNLATNTVKCTILQYSGMQNPHWSFTSTNDLKTLRSMLMKLPEAQTPQWPSLDYRGLMLTADEKKTGFPQMVVVFNGVIQLTEHGQKRFFQDTKGLENFLKDEARKRGLGDYLQ